MPFTRLAVAAVLALLSNATAVFANDVQDANRLFRQGQYSPALDRVNGYLANNPKDPQARFLKGLILTEQNRAAEAIKLFQGLTEDFPELPEPYNNLAVLYAAQGEYDKAKTALEMAIRTHPSYATAHENLGDIYAKLATQAYDKALQLDKSNTSAQTKLSLIRDLFPGATDSPDGRGKGSRTKPTVAVTESHLPATDARPMDVAKETVSAPPTTTPKPVATPTGDPTEEALRIVEAWAAAWTRQDQAAYLSFYATDFKPPRGMDRNVWENERRERIARPKKIEVVIEKPRIKRRSNDQVSVSFRQIYRSDSLNSQSRKTLILGREADGWRIREERSQ